MINDAVTVATDAVEVFAANGQARQRIIVNNYSTVLYGKYGSGCTTSLFTFMLQPYETYTDDGPDMNHSQITCIRATGSGPVVKTER